MDTENLEPIDILAHITEELQGRYRSAKDDPVEQLSVFIDFLRRWDADTALGSLKKLQIEFEKDLDWFNVSQPLSMKALRGKLVVLDFFTYCCINCMHVLPELRALEELFPSERGLAVVGVHSPKFENEKEGINILAAAQRYDIAHPIVNDPRSTMWAAVGIRCWPSLLVLSPSGTPMLLLMGEGHGRFLQGFVEQALRYFEHKAEIVHTPLPLMRSAYGAPMPASTLRFPAKIARSDDGRFAVADAGNNRILVFNINGHVLQRIGGGGAGFVDGDFERARFNAPQGLAFLDGDVLVVADTENHALRQITLSTRRVETLAGTGQQGDDRVGGKIGPLQAISSPWDVAVFRTRDMDMSFHMDEGNVPEKPVILVAMAGTHQIWGYFPEGSIWWKFRKYLPRICVPLIGNGSEENRNNSYPQNAGFAQPSGLAMAKSQLFIADSESSSVRKASMVDGKVVAVVGGDRNPLNLFAYGDVDGKQYSAKLQHPLGVAYNHADDRIYVADTYNHKIKAVDSATNTVETVPVLDASTGSLYSFNEPAGLCFDTTGHLLLVSDTNNHSIQCVDMRTLETRRFALSFTFAHPELSETDSPAATLRTGVQLLKTLPLRKYKELTLRVAITLADDLKFTAEAPQKWRIRASQSPLRAVCSAGQICDGVFDLHLKRPAGGTRAVHEDIKLDIALSLCDAKSCLIKRFTLTVNDDVDESQDADDSNEALETKIVVEQVNVHINEADIKIR